MYLGVIGLCLKLKPEHLAEEGYLHELEIIPRVRDRVLRPALRGKRAREKPKKATNGHLKYSVGRKIPEMTTFVAD